MRPALSIVVFTVTSGLGLGLIAVAALAELLGRQILEGPVLVLLAGAAFVTVSAGLGASTFHLANPRNAWRAFARVRTSWLSREAVLALALYPVVASWLWMRARGGEPAPGLATASALLALGTVFTTGMIYACLRTVRQWYTPLTPAWYLGASLGLGALALHAIALLAGDPGEGLAAAACGLVASAFCIKVAWLRGVGTRRPVDPQTATGLGPETIRLLDIGHSAGTYLTRELCYPLAPGRARGLRGLALALAFLAPLALVLGAPTSLWAALLALASAYCGMLVERWLFFAEATHVVSLFHGARSA